MGEEFLGDSYLSARQRFVSRRMRAAFKSMGRRLHVAAGTNGVRIAWQVQRAKTPTLPPSFSPASPLIIYVCCFLVPLSWKIGVRNMHQVSLRTFVFVVHRLLLINGWGGVTLAGAGLV